MRPEPPDPPGPIATQRGTSDAPEHAPDERPSRRCPTRADPRLRLVGIGEEPIEDDRPPFARRCTDAPPAGKRLLRRRDALGGVGVEPEDRLPRPDLFADGSEDLDAGPCLHRLTLPGAAGAETPCGDADSVRIHVNYEAVGFGGDLLGVTRGRQRRVDFTALRSDHLAPLVHRPLVVERSEE